ncbi:MAG: DUF58 domain-containing protein [Nitrospiria bacterium]
MKRLIYQIFRILSVIQSRMKKRFTVGGAFVLCGLALTALFGLDTSRMMIYQSFTFLFALMAVSYVYSQFFDAGFSVKRIIPRFGTVGEPLRYQLEVRNESAKTQSGLTLLEDLGETIPTFDEFINSREPNEEDRNWFDRYVGYYRWQWIVSRKVQGGVRERTLPSVKSGKMVEIQSELVPFHRGRLCLNGVTIARKDPFGLVKTPLTVRENQTVQVLPKRYPLPAIQFPGVKKYQQGGVAMTSSVGESEDFVSLRDYRIGDPMRRIHWKSWAKIGKPIVKEYQEEYFVRHALVLDTFLDSDFSDIFEEGVSIAASFASSMQTMESLLDLMFVGGESYCFTAGRALSSMERILEILSSVRLCRDKPFLTLSRSVINRISMISGCICILLAWDKERRDFIDQLKRYGIPLLVLVVGDASMPDPLDLGPMKENPSSLHRLEVGKIKEGLSKI